MKKILLFLPLFFLSSPSLFSQGTVGHHIEFGVDLTSIIIWASGGDRDYSEFKFIYRESTPDLDSRFKLTISDFNYLGKKVFLSRQIENNQPNRLTYLEVGYTPEISYLLSIGLGKYLKENELPVYFGADLNVGLSRGEMRTDLREITVGKENRMLQKSIQNNLFLLGVNPFVGTKLKITENILFGLEFGININAPLGKLKYQNEAGQTLEESFNRLDLGLDRLINDITLLINI